MKKGKSKLMTLLQSRILLIFLIVITVLSGVRLTNEVIRRQKINTEINNLQGQINTLEDEQRSLSALINYLNTDSYIEEQARKKLNLSRPGESIIVVGDEQASDTVKQTGNKSPIILWVNYFFNKNENT